MGQNYNTELERHLVKGTTLRKDDDSKNYVISLVLKS